MIHISVRCYAELNDFLISAQKYTVFPLSLPENSNLDTLVKKIGISPQIIELILVNGCSVNLEYRPRENDRIVLYPIFETFDISSLIKIHSRPLRDPKFVIDVHLGRLARHLRMFGFDTLYQNNSTTDSICEISLKENRILLSKNRSLIKSGFLTHVYIIKSKEPYEQLKEVFSFLDLYTLATPFTRCMECNSLLNIVKKESITSLLPESVGEWCNEYQHCPQCDRIYWKGSHYQHMSMLVQDILNGKYYFGTGD